MSEVRQIVIKKDEKGRRIDAYLASAYPDLSRSRIQDLLSRGLIEINGSVVKPSYKIMEGDHVILKIPEADPTHLLPQEISIPILFEDDEIVVINKPAGLVVHPGAGNPTGTLANALIHLFPDMHVKNSHRPGLVHRLDKETSGVMVCARNDSAFQNLVLQFKSRGVRKIYSAFCFGGFKKEKFELITGHARHKSDRKKYTTKIEPPKETGRGIRLAHSKFEVTLQAGGISALKVELLTGRTHQIRAHLSDIQHPLLQDGLYGGKERVKNLKDTVVRQSIMLLKRHALHAHRLEFAHPKTGKKLEFEAELPEDLRAIQDAMIMLNAEGHE